MVLKDYILYSIKNKLVHKQKWFFVFFTILSNERKNEYVEIKNKEVYVTVNGNSEKLDDVTFTEGKSLFNITHTIGLSSGDLPNINRNIATTIGRLIVNYLLISRNFDNKIEYINTEFSVSSLEGDIAKLLMEDKITVESYLNFVDSVYYICGLARIFNISATERNLTPPAGISEFKKKLRKEFDGKYGSDWVNDKTKIVEFQEQLKKQDDEWLKDDPTKGRLLNKKIKDNARVKMFLTFGGEVGLDKKSGNVTFIENSLLDGYSKDPKEISAMFNSIRAASFDRGHETQKGGAAAKDLLRASSSISIKEGDCGTKLTKKILITEDNHKSFTGRYYVHNGKVTAIEDTSSLIGKTIELRSPMYCNEPNSNYCSICVGKTIAINPKGVSMQLLDVSAVLLTASLKSMHNSQLNAKRFNIQDMVK